MPARDLDRMNSDPQIARLEQAVSDRVGATRFQLWFRTRTAFVLTATTVTVHVPDDAFRAWLEDRFGDAVREAAVEVLGGKPNVRYEVSPNLLADEVEPVKAAPAAKPAPEVSTAKTPMPKRRATLFGDELEPPPSPPPVRGRKAKSADSAKTAKVAEPTPKATPQAPAAPRNTRRWKTLAEFVPGVCNRLAHASVVSILEQGDDAPNPLVLHGPVGTGKTHLLESLYVGLRARRGSEKPLFVTAEEFTTRFVQASRFEKHEQFRRQFRDSAALLLDDLQFLGSKPGTQREFLHTLDALVADGRPVVVTLDCHPRMNDQLLPELIDRLVGGGVWGLLPPDDETRLAVLRAKATGGTPAIPDSVLKLVAKGLRGNVRELEGALNTLRHIARVTGRPVDAALAREALGDLLRHSVRGVSVAGVDAAVVAVLGLPGGALQSKARSWAVTHPRAVAIYLCRKHTAATYGEIAKHFGVKTHSTAVAAEKRVVGWLAARTEIAVGDRRWPIRELLERVEREFMK